MHAHQDSHACCPLQDALEELAEQEEEEEELEEVRGCVQLTKSQVRNPGLH
jgi:hypothetical protein